MIQASPRIRAPAFVHLGPPQISDAEYRLFQETILKEAGIHLSENKRALLVGRLMKRLRELGIGSFGDYHRLVKERPDDELVRMLDSICTNETHFFREPQHFHVLESQVFRVWEERARTGQMAKAIRVWSAGCSSGEEPYSLAMALLSRFPPEAGWSVEIFATDLSTKVLSQAESGLFSVQKSSQIPGEYLKRFMLRGVGSQQGKMKAGNEIRSVVRFMRLNLNDANFPALGRFDAIFCRNVLIYFKHESKARVIHQLLSHLAPGSYLFLGHSETLNGICDSLRPVIPTVYVNQPRERVGIC